MLKRGGGLFEVKEVVRGGGMTWRRVLKSVQALLAHGSLFCFTLLLVLKLDHFVSHSWWYFIYLFVSSSVLRSL